MSLGVTNVDALAARISELEAALREVDECLSHQDFMRVRRVVRAAITGSPSRPDNMSTDSALSDGGEQPGRGFDGAASAPPGSRNQSVVVTDWGHAPAPTAAGAMVVSAPPVPIVGRLWA